VRKPSTRGTPARLPTENAEQIAVVDWLRKQLVNGHPVTFVHVPNEGKRSAQGNTIAQAMGLQPGFPDLLIITTTELAPRGAFIELKRRDGGKRSDRQILWGRILREREGLKGDFFDGAREAVVFLASLGYGPPPP